MSRSSRGMLENEKERASPRYAIASKPLRLSEPVFLFRKRTVVLEQLQNHRQPRQNKTHTSWPWLLLWCDWQKFIRAPDHGYAKLPQRTVKFDNSGKRLRWKRWGAKNLMCFFKWRRYGKVIRPRRCLWREVNIVQHQTTQRGNTYNIRVDRSSY